MRSMIIGLFVLTYFCACEPEAINPANCDNTATVEDFTGLDGCGFLFKLDNGDYLEPVRNIFFCGTPLLTEGYNEDPLSGFELKAGQRVRLGYEDLEDYGSICMNGKAVRITCLELISEAPVE